MRLCPKCRNHFDLVISDSPADPVRNVCKTCGFSEPFVPKTKDEALLLETTFRTGSSANGAASGYTVNDYTLLDPAIPHVNTLRCPNGGCISNTDASKRDVAYLATDPVNLKFLYICANCKTQWTN